jgi:hypothetical protein
LLPVVLRRPALHFSQPFDIIETAIMPNRNPAARMRLVWFILTILLAVFICLYGLYDWGYRALLVLAWLLPPNCLTFVAFVPPFDGAHGNYSFVREVMMESTVAVPSGNAGSACQRMSVST